MIEISKVEKVYTGRQGCMCGCRGKYSWATAHRGRRYWGDEQISDRSVKIIVNKLNRNPNTKIDGDIAYLELDSGRVLAAYLLDD